MSGAWSWKRSMRSVPRRRRLPSIAVSTDAVPARHFLSLVAGDGDPVAAGTFVEAWPDGSHRFAHNDHGIYDVDREGREVIVETGDPAAAEVRVFLLTAVLSALCLKRQLFPLHASAAVVDGGAVAFVGSSGVGKSTIAAALMRQGHMVLADDLTVIDDEKAQNILTDHHIFNGRFAAFEIYGGGGAQIFLRSVIAHCFVA